jgi:hypothetical protein
VVKIHYHICVVEVSGIVLLCWGRNYSFRLIVLLASMDIYIDTEICLDTSILATSNMDQREYVTLDPWMHSRYQV